jgi:hypothetical protein
MIPYLVICVLTNTKYGNNWLNGIIKFPNSTPTAKGMMDKTLNKLSAYLFQIITMINILKTRKIKLKLNRYLANVEDKPISNFSMIEINSKLLNHFTSAFFLIKFPGVVRIKIMLTMHRMKLTHTNQ